MNKNYSKMKQVVQQTTGESFVLFLLLFVFFLLKSCFFVDFVVILYNFLLKMVGILKFIVFPRFFNDSGAPGGPCWGHLGPSWAILGHLGAILGHLGPS